jgi:hypothetical protein
MPNWIRNEVTVTGNAGAVYDLLFRDGKVDFEVMLPMPPSLMNSTEGTLLDVGLAIIGANPQYWQTPEQAKKYYDDFHPTVQEDIIAQTLIGVENILRYGHRSWLSWAREHWGVKWNASTAEFPRPEGPDFEFKFETAWATPAGVWETLREIMPPETTIRIKWLDEGGGAGIIIITKDDWAEEPCDENYWPDDMQEEA